MQQLLNIAVAAAPAVYNKKNQGVRGYMCQLPRVTITTTLSEYCVKSRKIHASIQPVANLTFCRTLILTIHYSKENAVMTTNMYELILDDGNYDV